MIALSTILVVVIIAVISACGGVLLQASGFYGKDAR